MQIGLQRSAVSPNSTVVSNGKFGESSYSLKTSTELLKVLNRIWSLEEKHALDMSLVRTLRRELEQSQAQVQELMQEKKRDQNEIDQLKKQMAEYKVARKREQFHIKDAVKLVEGELESRRHSEKRNHKLAKELSQMKCSFSNVLRELDGERRARILLEDLCDEFAKGIRDFEEELRITRHKYCEDQIGKRAENEKDRLILHISEAWLDERAQMKLASASDVSDPHSALDKLCLEIEAFLQEKQSDHPGKNLDVSFSSTSPPKSRVHPHSFESFHLNDPASAPWHGNDDEDDSIGTSSLRPHLSRGYSLKQDTTRPKPRTELHSRRLSDPSSSQIHSQEKSEEQDLQQVTEGSTKSRNMNSSEASHHPRMPRKGEILQRSTREGKTDSTDLRTRSRLGQDHHSHRMEGLYDPSTFVGPASPTKRWTSEVPTADPDPSEHSTRGQNGVKPNTLKAKLFEARLEEQSRTRTTAKGLPKAE